MKIKRIHAVSPLSLLVLSACGGGSSSSSGQADLINLVGNVVNGPLKNALVFIDRDGDGSQGALEPDLRSGNSGQYDFNDAYLTEQGFTDDQITALAADIDAGNYSIVAKSDELTVVNYGGDNPADGDEQPAGSFTLSAPSGSVVVTPITTIIDGIDDGSSLDADQIAAALGLPDGVDPLSFNPFSSSNSEQALAVEKVSMQVLTTLEALEQAAAAVLPGAAADSAGQAAVSALVGLIDTKIAAATDGDGNVDLESVASINLTPTAAELAADAGAGAGATSDLFSIMSNLVTEIGEISDTADTTNLENGAIVEKIGNSISNFNTLIDEVESLSDSGTKDLFATAKLNADTVATGVASGDVSDFSFSTPDAVSAAVSNSTPSGIIIKTLETDETVEVVEFAENEDGQGVLYKLVLEDAETDDVADAEYDPDKRAQHVFEKVMVEDADGNEVDVDGSDGSLFEVVKLDGSYYLRLKSDASLDFESADHDGGKYTVWVKGIDDGGKSITKQIEIQATDVNEAPILSEGSVTAQEDVAFSYVIPATDPEGDDVTFSVVSELPSWLEFSSSTGTLFGTPTNDDVGEYSVAVSMTDANGLSSSDTLTVTVANVNDDPEFETTPTRDATQGQAYSTVFEVSDVDNEAADLTIALNEEISADWLSFDPETNTLSGTPSASDVSTEGAASAVSLTLSDGSGGSEVLSFNITVANVNDAPEIADITAGSVTEGTPGESVASENISGTLSVTDPDTGFVEESVTVTLDGATDNVKAGVYGSLTFDPTDNSYVYTPNEETIGGLTEGQAVTDTFTFTATDSNSATGSATFTVNVTGANDKPVITVGDDDLAELSDLGSGGRVGTLTSDDDDDDAEEITYTLTEASDANDNASFEIVDGNVLKLKDDVVTNRSEQSSYSVEITATDSGGLTSEAKTLEIGVSSFNSPPTITEFSADVESGILAIGDDINFTALVSETVNEGSSFSVTLSNGATFDMNRSASSKTTFTGTYTVAEGDDVTGSDVLSISSYSSGSVVEENYAENGSPQALTSGSDTIDIGTVQIDATPPTATLESTGHEYDAATGTLELLGSDFDTMGVSDGGSVKDILDFTKMTWNVDGQNSVTMVMGSSDISTAVATDSSKLTIVLTADAQDSLHNLSGFGGTSDTGGTADVINFEVGFLRDAAGNASSAQNALNADVAMADQTSPTFSGFSASTVGDATLLGIGDAITMNLTFGEALRADSTASIVLSNGGTVQLTVSDADAKVLTGDYVVSVDDDDVRGSDTITLSSIPLFTVADISGNVLDNPGVDAVDASAISSIEIDATPPEATIANTGHEYDASTGILTLVGTNLTTLLDDPSATSVVNQLDFTKLSWNVDGAGSVTMTMSADDIASAVVTNATTLTVTLSADGQEDLHALAGFGGSEATGGTGDALDIAVGFLRDPAGNESSGQSSPVVGSVAMADTTAPVIQSITSATDETGALGPDDVITLTAQLSEAAKAGSTMTVTLSNGATVSLTADATDPTTMVGDYTIDEDDDDTNSDSPLTVQAYSVGTTTDISGNALGSETAVDSIDNVTAHVIDTTAPTAGLASTGHTYNVSTGVLTLAGTNLTTLLSDPSDTDVVDVLDFTKLTWNVNAAGSVTMTMSAEDVASAVVTDATTLTITLSADGQTDLHALAGFGGTDSTGGIADGIDVAVGFLLDAAGNESSGQVGPITAAEVTLSDVTAPTLTTITSTPSTAAAFGVGDTITFSATLNEAIKAGTSMSVTLSNDATVTLTGDGTNTITGDYVVDAEDSDSDGLSISNFAVNSLVDLSGNALSDELDISTVDNITANVIDTTPARVLISQFLSSSNELVVAFNEAVTDASIDALEAALQGLDMIADDASISTSDNITTKISVNNVAAKPADNILDVADFDVEDLTGNILTITTLDIA